MSEYWPDYLSTVFLSEAGLGQEISSDSFSPEDFADFGEHLKAEMELLKSWFEGEKFCDDRLQCGLELEAWLVDEAGLPVPDNQLFLNTCDRDFVVPELAKFNFEVNVSPQYLAGTGLRDMRSELTATWSRCNQVADRMGHYVHSIGILPTVTQEMLSEQNRSPMQRYKALDKRVAEMRDGEPLRLSIAGIDELDVRHSSMMLESAATSIQIHLKVPLWMSVRFYNASVIASALTIAAAANAPFLFGKQLWDDTRIPLFENSLNTGEPIPRVTFGDRYIESSLWEVFESNYQQYEYLLPAAIEGPPSRMPYVRMHNGTVWNWNRPLIGFETDGQPHLRIEHRPLSASPSISDLFADMALYLGLVNYLAHTIPAPEQLISYNQAHSNFYEAARHSLRARVKWLDGRDWKIQDLLQDHLLEKAMDWLCAAGVRQEEVSRAHEILIGRVESGQNGAVWQRKKRS